MSRVVYSEWRSAPKSATYYRIELHKAGYSGAERRVNAQSPFVEHRYTSLNPREPQKTPILDATLTYHFRVESAQDVALLEDIFESQPGVYTLKKYVNNELDWTGEVDTDRIEYVKGAFPFGAKIIARDIAPQRGKDYPLTSGRVRIIEAIAEMLPLELPIRSYTSWKEGTLTATQDFLLHRRIDRTGLRTYARTGDEPDETISRFEALELLAKNFGLIIRQSGGAWRIYQLTALGNPDSVRRYRYDKDGAFVSSADVDITVQDDRDELYLIPTNNLKGLKSYKEVEARFDHRTTIQGILLPSLFVLEGIVADREFSQFFAGDGTQRIEINGQVNAEYADAVSDITARIKIRVGQYYWDDENFVWSTDTNTVVTVEMGERRVPEFQLGTFFILTAPIPSDANSPIELSFSVATDNPITTTWRPTFELLNQSVADGNNTAIDYKLTQVRDASARYDHGAVWFGDGPTSYALSAISRDDGGLQPTSSWFRGAESGVNFFNILLREVMDTQRFASRFVQANIWGGYSIGQVITDATGDYFFIGGTLSGRDNIWQADLLRINIQTAGTDVFEIIFRTTADASTGSAPASGGGSIGGGLTQGVADNRYLRQSLNLSDLNDIANARANLDVLSEGEILDITDLLASAIAGNELDIKSLALTKADKGTQINAGDGMQGGGLLTDDVTVTMGEPSKIDVGTTNSVTSDSHTHELDLSGRSVDAGDGLTGGGNLSANRTITLGTPSTTTVGGSNGVTSDSHTHALDLSGRTLTAGNGLTGGGNLGADRTFDVDPNEPIYINSGKVDIRDATDLIRGVVTTSAQKFAGEKTFEDAIILDPQTTDPSVGAGKVWFDEDLQTISFYDENDNIIRVNQQVTVRVKNTSGASIAKGVPVRVCISGFAGDLVCVRPAQGDTATNSNVIGVTAEAIANNAVGTAIEFGKLEKVNTNSFNVGDTLFLSPTVAGGLTTTKPTYSDFAIRIGIVTRKSSTVGAILILIEQNFDIFTSGRVMFANGDGRIAEDSEFNFDASESELQVPNIAFDGKIESDDYLNTGGLIAGFKVTNQGDLETRSIRANELRVKSFIAEVSAALYGEDILTKSRGVVSRPFTVPNASGTTRLFVEDLEGLQGLAVFESGDTVRMRVIDRAGGGLTVFDVWGAVSDYNDEGDGEQSWDFLRVFPNNNDFAGETVQVGSIALDYGVSGDGFIRRTVLEDNSPKSEIITWVNNPYTPANYTVRTTEGNVTGLPGVTGSQVYGQWVQDNFYARFGNGALRFGRDADGAGNAGLYFDANNYWLLNEGFKSTITDNLDSASLDIQSALIQLQLETKGAYSGLTFLAGRAILSAQANGKIASIDLDANPEDGSVIQLVADWFDFQSNDIVLQGAGVSRPGGSLEAKFVLGASASGQSLDIGTGLFADGAGNFRVGSATGQLDTGMEYNASADTFNIRSGIFDLQASGLRLSNDISGVTALQISEEISSVFYNTVNISSQTSFNTSPVAVTSFASIGGSFPQDLNDSSIIYRPNSSPGLSVVSGNVYELELEFSDTASFDGVVVQINIDLYDGASWVTQIVRYPKITSSNTTIRPTIFVPTGFTHIRVGSIINSGQPGVEASWIKADIRRILSSVQLNTQGLRVNKNSEEFVQFDRAGFKTTLPIQFRTGTLFEDGLKRLVWTREDGTQVILATAP